MTPLEILDLPMQENDADASTIRGYLVELVKVAWDEKRPFGNSGWKHELWTALAQAGVIDATFDEDGCIDACDSEAGERLIAEAIEALAAPSPGPAQ